MRWRAKPFICFWLSYVFVSKFSRNQHEIACTIKQIVAVGRPEALVSAKCQLQTVDYHKSQNASEQNSSVQFSSKWYLCARKSPYALRPVSQNFPQRCFWDGSNVRLSDDGPLSSFQGKSSSASSFRLRKQNYNVYWSQVWIKLILKLVCSKVGYSHHFNKAYKIPAGDRVAGVASLTLPESRLCATREEGTQHPHSASASSFRQLALKTHLFKSACN